jgi:hypothetical protein
MKNTQKTQKNTQRTQKNQMQQETNQKADTNGLVHRTLRLRVCSIIARYERSVWFS